MSSGRGTQPGRDGNWTQRGRGRGGRGGRGAHPHNLRGRDIGLFYAAKSRAKDAELFNDDDGSERKPLTAEERRVRKIVRNLRDERPQRLEMSNEAILAFEAAIAAAGSSHGASGSGQPPRAKNSTPKRPRLDTGRKGSVSGPQNVPGSADRPIPGPLLSQRKKLPAWSMRAEVVAAVSSNQCVVVSGQTGCGKTTQVPQFILDDALASNGKQANIICTQPRRISAVGVAERVADERGEPCGVTVGYRIRLDAVASPSTRLLFCTTGILLRMLQDEGDGVLSAVTHVVVDEIHERSLDTDFLLILLRELLPQRPDLRVVLMSATVNAAVFAEYFGGAPVVNIPGFTFPVRRYYLEDVVSKTRYQARNPLLKLQERRQRPSFKEIRDLKSSVRSRDVAAELAEMRRNGLGAKYTDADLLSVSNLMDYGDGSVPLDLIVSCLQHICFDIDRVHVDRRDDSSDAMPAGHEKVEFGAVLIFLPGWDDISKLHSMLQAHRTFGDRQSYLLLPLHSSMPTASQRKIFRRPPPGVRKVVLATNIAETSITIDDVEFVIDSGRFKEMSYDPATNVSCLQPEWVSKASALQRSGRAGRVREGVCFHLFSSLALAEFKDYQEAEMLRTPLESLCLQVRALRLLRNISVSSFLERALDPPDKRAVSAALSTLRAIGALQESPVSEELTTLGSHLAKLPVAPRLGKMLIFSVMFGCLGPCLTIASSLGFRNPFVLPLDKKEAADRAKSDLACGRGDHGAYLAAYDGWKQACRSSSGPAYARRHFLSESTLSMIDDMREQFLRILADAGFVTLSRGFRYDDSLDANAANWGLVKGVLLAGLFPSVCRVDYRRSMSLLFTRNDGSVKPHPGSVHKLRERTLTQRWAVYYEKVRSSGMFLFDLTEVTPVAMCIFGGAMSIVESSRRVAVTTGDGDVGAATGFPADIAMRPWITFDDSSGVGASVLEVKKIVSRRVQMALEKPGAFEFSSSADGGSEIVKAIAIALRDAEAVAYHEIPWREGHRNELWTHAGGGSDGESSDGDEDGVMGAREWGQSSSSGWNRGSSGRDDDESNYGGRPDGTQGTGSRGRGRRGGWGDGRGGSRGNSGGRGYGSGRGRGGGRGRGRGRSY